MSATLKALRRDLDLMPSPLPDRPGLLLRDPYGYANGMLVVPPALAPCLALFDGARSELDLRQALVRITGGLEVGEILRQLVGALEDGGFLEGEAYRAARAARHREFAAAPVRLPAHAGPAYPEDASALRERFAGYLAAGPPRAALPGGEPGAGELAGIAAPHVSPEGGHASYAAAYGRLGPWLADRTFVILGTSHYGEPERFGLTRKPFRTPLGDASVELPLVERLLGEAGEAAADEDYCHAIEHSIEFQVVFLQHAVGPGLRILPILCGPFAHSLLNGGWPEDTPGVARFLAALGALQAELGPRLFWVLGVDLAHVGARYGDRAAARTGSARMRGIAVRDAARLQLVAAADAQGFWRLVRENADELRWCGSSPLYTFLRAGPRSTGELLRYEQWNIDEASVVSFCGMAFRRSAAEARIG